jgi:hypothetical protein
VSATFNDSSKNTYMYTFSFLVNATFNSAGVQTYGDNTTLLTNIEVVTTYGGNTATDTFAFGVDYSTRYVWLEAVGTSYQCENNVKYVSNTTTATFTISHVKSQVGQTSINKFLSGMCASVSLSTDSP